MQMRDEWKAFLCGAGACLSALTACLFALMFLSNPGIGLGVAVVCALAVCAAYLFNVWTMVRDHDGGARWRRSTAPAAPDAFDEVVHAHRDIANAFEIERRRIERDLHDGAQQFIVAASMDIGEAALMLDDLSAGDSVDPASMRSVSERLESAAQRTGKALSALRRTVAGIHPKVLSDLGLEAAVRDLADASPLDADVKVPIPLPDIPQGVIAAGYFMVAECLTNAAKYAPHAHVTVLVIAGENLQITVTDDGPGGASVRADGGLAGMRERLASFGGSLDVSSPEGGPTIISGRIPLMLMRGEFSVTSRAGSPLTNKEA